MVKISGIRWIMVVATLSLMTGMVTFADVKAPKLALDKQILDKNGDCYIEKKIKSDVTGDGKLDTVYLIAHKASKKAQDGVYIDRYKLVVVEGSRGRWIEVKLPKSMADGFNGKLSVADMCLTPTPEIILQTSKGGTTAFIKLAVFTFEKNTFKVAFDSERKNELMKVSGHYADGYRVNLELRSLGRKFDLNVLDRKAVYERDQVYIGTKFNQAVSPDVRPMPEGGGLSGVSFEINKTTKRKDLIWHTQIKGISESDLLAEIKVRWVADGNELKAIDAELVPMPVAGN